MKLRLAELMDERGLNQVQVAEGLGVSPGVVNSWLKGKKRAAGAPPDTVWPSFPLFEALCVFFGVGPSDLLEVEAATTPSGKTWQDFGPARGPGRPKKATPEEKDAALEYVDEARQAYEDATARGDKQTQLRKRGRTLTEAMVGAIEAGVELEG
jgi:transcriptional regulator with XRE-family HTH domain